MALTKKTRTEEAAVQREIRRQRRVVDQQLTIYSILANRYDRYATALTMCVLAGSTVTAGFAFAADARLTIIGVSASRTTWIGWLSLLTFLLSLVEITTGWRKKAARYRDGAVRLSELKSVYRGADIDALTRERAAELSAAYQRTMANAPEIKDRQFVRLKAAHVRKVALSELVSDDPAAPLRALRHLLREEGRPAKRAAREK